MIPRSLIHSLSIDDSPLIEQLREEAERDQSVLMEAVYDFVVEMICEGPEDESSLEVLILMS